MVSDNHNVTACGTYLVPENFTLFLQNDVAMPNPSAHCIIIRDTNNVTFVGNKKSIACEGASCVQFAGIFGITAKKK